MKQAVRSQSRSRPKQKARDPQKERRFQELSRLLAEHGYTVRREELKSGRGWRVLSGTCRALEQRLIFVERRLSQDEQIQLLLERTKQIGVGEESPATRTMDALPPEHDERV